MCCTQQVFYSLFTSARFTILFDIALPLLVTSKFEYFKMVDEPEEFIALALDTVDKQRSDIPKTEAAKLLETLCDHIDGSTSLIASFFVTILNIAISTLNGKEIVTENSQ